MPDRNSIPQKSEHCLRLKTPALYALEVYLFNYYLYDVSPEDFEDVRLRFKFMDFACVEALGTVNTETIHSPPSAYSTSSPTSSPSSPSSRAGEQPQPTAEAAEPEKEDNTKPEEGLKDETKEDGQKAGTVPAVAEEAEGKLQPEAPPEPQQNLKRDPKYFDPRKLLRPKQSGPSSPSGQLVGNSEGTTEPTGAAQDSQPEGSHASLHGTSTEGDEKLPTDTLHDLEMEAYEDEENYSEVLTEDDHHIPFENGSSLMFCQQPFNLLHSLPRHPLLLFLFRPPSEVIGSAQIYMDPLLDAVDKSIVLTKSIPLSGVIRDSFEIFLKGKKVGRILIEIKLTCFGPYALHRTYLPENPNDKSKNDTNPRGASQHIIVVQMSANDLGDMRHKSKIFVSKSNPVLVGKIRRDISDMTPIVCGDENYVKVAKVEKTELTVVEREELEKEEARIAQLEKFPQYRCLDDWETVFTRNVIKDLILKNRRPFQWGSPDRKYVESYFPDLMPDNETLTQLSAEQLNPKTPEAKLKSKKRVVGKGGPSLAWLPLEKEWLVKHELDRIRRKSVKPAVSTKRNTKDRTWSLGMPSIHSLVKLPTHHSASMSHVAVANFDMEKGDSNVPDREVQASDYGACSYNSASVSCPGGGKMEITAKPGGKPESNKSCRALDSSSKIFNTRHPRMFSGIEKYNPLPDRPFCVKVNAPERYPSDKMEQTLRDVLKEVEVIGGETKMLYDHDSYPDSIFPEHLKRSLRTILRPETTIYGDGEAELVYIEVAKGVPLLLPARCSPYWEGHVKVCENPLNCDHFLILHPGFGYYGR